MKFLKLFGHVFSFVAPVPTAVPKTVERMDGPGLLLAAAHILERDGWTTGVMADHVGRRCLRGAMEKARFENRNNLVIGANDIALKLLHKEINLWHSRDHISITGWNDFECTGQNHAVLVLKRAANQN